MSRFKGIKSGGKGQGLALHRRQVVPPPSQERGQIVWAQGALQLWWWKSVKFTSDRICSLREMKGKVVS